MVAEGNVTTLSQQKDHDTNSIYLYKKWYKIYLNVKITTTIHFSFHLIKHVLFPPFTPGKKKKEEEEENTQRAYKDYPDKYVFTCS